MPKTSITKKAYFKIAKLSFFYSIILTTVVIATSIYYFKSSKINDIRDKILLATHAISKQLINKNYPLLIKDIQQKTLLQEIAIYTEDCSLKASTSLVPNLCKNNSFNFNSINTKINSTPVIIFYKYNYPFNVFIKMNLNPLIVLFSSFFLVTSFILYLFLNSTLIAPINKLKLQLKSSNETALPIELDFISLKLIELKKEIESVEKERTYFNLARQVVHDIRNPLAYLKMMCQSNDLDSSSFNKKIQEIDYQINNLLVPGIKNSSEVISVEFLKDLSDDLGKLFNLSINIKNNLEDVSLRPAINNFDLKNILTNLARNSAEAGATKIDLQIRIMQNFIDFIFTDNGSGISTEASKKIFSKNFTTKSNGNGIGLNSLKAFIETHRGLFQHVSSFTDGAQFNFKIPFISLNETYVMIDDDKFMRQAWKIAASNKKIQLYTFPSVEDFLSFSDKIPKSSEIYIDSDLGSNLKGEIISESIFNAGYQSIYLSTSFDDINISSYPWLKSLASKHPPF